MLVKRGTEPGRGEPVMRVTTYDAETGDRSAARTGDTLPSPLPASRPPAGDHQHAGAAVGEDPMPVSQAIRFWHSSCTVMNVGAG